jgi:hypothetical protein
MHLAMHFVTLKLVVLDLDQHFGAGAGVWTGCCVDDAPGDALGDALGEALGDGLGDALGCALGNALGDAHGRGDCHCIGL